MSSTEICGFLLALALVVSCGPPTAQANDLPIDTVSRSFEHVAGPVSAAIELRPAAAGTVAIEVALKVENEVKDMVVEYDYRHSLDFHDRSPFELWNQQRHMYDLVLPSGLSWGDLVTVSPAPPHGPVLLRIQGASEEPEMR